MPEKFIEISFSPAKLFYLYIKGHGYSYRWISGNIDVSPTYISLTLSEKVPLSENVRKKLNELLETNY